MKQRASKQTGYGMSEPHVGPTSKLIPTQNTDGY